MPDLHALLKESCNLLAEECDTLRAGITIFADGSLSNDPHDAPTVQRIGEIENWIERAGAALTGGGK